MFSLQELIGFVGSFLFYLVSNLIAMLLDRLVKRLDDGSSVVGDRSGLGGDVSDRSRCSNSRLVDGRISGDGTDRRINCTVKWVSAGID